VVKSGSVFLLPLLLAFASLELPAEDLTPRIGAIEIYGVKKTPVSKIRQILGVQEGGPLPASKGEVEDALDKIPGVVASRLEAACCVEGKMVLYVGIEEKGAPHLEFRPEPDGDITLPSELTDNYSDFIDGVNQSMRLGQQGESLNLGYSLMENSGTRTKQQAFIPLAAKYMDTLHQVIRTSRDPEQRAMAAYILQYGPRTPRHTPSIVDDLQFALQDIDDTVRANAIRALTAMYVGTKLHPEQNAKIQPTWFVELLNSIVWSDRHNAAVALVDMTEDQHTSNDTLQLIRERALTSVVDMARWHDLSHALPAFILVGRLAGLPEKQIQDAWVNSDHEAIIKQAVKRKPEY
jgi:hypothetical protein